MILPSHEVSIITNVTVQKRNKVLIGSIELFDKARISLIKQQWGRGVKASLTNHVSSSPCAYISLSQDGFPQVVFSQFSEKPCSFGPGPLFIDSFLPSLPHLGRPKEHVKEKNEEDGRRLHLVMEKRQALSSPAAVLNTCSHTVFSPCHPGRVRSHRSMVPRSPLSLSLLVLIMTSQPFLEL